MSWVCKAEREERVEGRQTGLASCWCGCVYDAIWAQGSVCMYQGVGKKDFILLEPEKEEEEEKFTCCLPPPIKIRLLLVDA